MFTLFSAFVRWLKLSRVCALKHPGPARASDLAGAISRFLSYPTVFDFARPTIDVPITEQFPVLRFLKPSVQVGHAWDLTPARARRQAQTVLGPLLRSAKNIGIGLAFAGILSAQGTIQLFQVIAPTASANFNNINPRYNAWTVMYNYSGSGTFSIELDCAPDATAAGGTPTAGSFITCTNVITGNNPSTTPKYGYITFLGYTPWLKLVLNSISSGNITVAAFGFNAADPESGSGGGCAGTVATPCIVAGPNATGASPTKNPVFIAGLDGAGNIIPANFPSLNAAISLSSSGLTQILALSGMTVIRVEHISLAFASGVNVQLEYGTGSNCGMGTTAVTGVYEAVTGLALDFDSGTLNIPAGNALCINLGSSVVGGGVIVYSQY